MVLLSLGTDVGLPETSAGNFPKIDPCGSRSPSGNRSAPGEIAGGR